VPAITGAVNANVKKNKNAIANFFFIIQLILMLNNFLIPSCANLE
jgi:hypothetical protein